MTTIQGIDVSNNNGVIDWAQVASDPAGYKFAFIKCTQGTTFVDAYYRRNVAGALANNIAPAAYHYAVPSQNTADDEATFFVAHYDNPIVPGRPIGLDFEDPRLVGDATAWTLRWLSQVAGRVGFNPGLYTRTSFITAHLDQTNQALAQYGLWLASWGLPSQPPAPAPWPFIAIWQDSASGSLPGVTGPVDLDVFNGSIEQFRLYGAPVPIVKTPTNDDFEQMHRLVDAQPFDAAALIGYARQFVGGGS